ncbi:type II toxin-antitoxin system VapC family toxin [Litorihabitans aurantiacus]|uniref:Ribonuclease VapC n=1 Tax=Litorihabitans aurantiacus TaxID=1930061 RepID=A0AA37XGU6_9MICO|nr:type II toxin-antitoxin system VapC family toxin [Litorihabitans aurantiacus]GMA32662.1 VapC ribonuclease [Litorihabitans aurantiacus]
MIVDSSALVAVLRDEPDAGGLRRAMAGEPRVVVGAPTLVETSVVVGPSRHGDLDDLLRDIGAVVAPFTPEHARIARQAYARYGRGSGSPARLNFGDAMSYAVAMEAGLPLLFKGDDFVHTDVERAEVD